MKCFPWRLPKKSIALSLAGMAAIAPALLPHGTAQANPLSDDEMPLELTFGDLDSSWRQVQVAGIYSQYEFAAPFMSLLSLVGFTNVLNNTYFTQGEMVEMGDAEYLVAYRVPPIASDVDLESLFSIWTEGDQCDSISELGSQYINRETKVQLSLLHPLSMGSLNDIESLDVDAVIVASEAQLAKTTERCETARAEALVDTAVANINSILWEQEWFWLDKSRFTDNPNELDLYFNLSGEDYTYSFNLVTPTLMTTEAIASASGGIHVVGAIAMVSEEGSSEPVFTSIICQNSESGSAIPSAPTLDVNSGFFSCPEGTFETSYY